MPELDFKGKEFVYNHHLAIPHRPFDPPPRQSVLPFAHWGEAGVRAQDSTAT